MKPEIGYDRIVIGSYINDLLEGVEWNLKRTALRDPYFNQLSIEKFTLETLLQELGEHGEISPTDLIERFVQKRKSALLKIKTPTATTHFRCQGTQQCPSWMGCTSDIWRGKDVADLKKHKNLWNDVVYGTPTVSMAAASKLNQLGEMSDKTFQIFVLASAIAFSEKKGGKRK